MHVDVMPAIEQLCALVTNVPDAALGNETPCGYPVGALLDHLATFAVVFTAAANKEADGRTGPPPAPDAAHLASDWRATIPRDLVALGVAWSTPEAWSGTTKLESTPSRSTVTSAVASRKGMRTWKFAVSPAA